MRASAKHLERRAGLAWQAATVRATHSAGDLFRKRPVIHSERSRETKELAQGGRVRVEAVGEDFVPHALQARYLWVTGNQVVEGRLDQRQRAHLRRAARGRDQRPQDPVRVRDDVRARVQQ